jgi:uncharacterized membrane protein
MLTLENFNYGLGVITRAMTLDTEKTAQYLAENPRMIGVLFTIGMLVSQAGSVLANDGMTASGP